MMDPSSLIYTEVKCSVKQEQSELLITYLSDLGFESFHQQNTVVKAYIPEQSFDQEALDQLQQQLNSKIPFQYTWKNIHPKNWNKAWEEEFTPITIEDRCYIKASFHKSQPEIPYQITINPQQSFGTGHHESTRLMIKCIFWLERQQGLKEQTILDVGCGTGVLSILAEQLKAEKVYAVDNNRWAFENTKHNIEINKCNRIQIMLGDILSDRFFNKLQQNVKFDTVFANLNKKLVLAGIPNIANRIPKAGIFIAGGFYAIHQAEVCQKVKRYSLEYCVSFKENEWTAIVFKKS